MPSDTVCIKPLPLEPDRLLGGIDPGLDARTMVDYNWYWHGVAARRGLIERLVCTGNSVSGYAVYGPHYNDRRLRNALPGAIELYHLVIDTAHQGRGLGRASVALVSSEAFAAHPDRDRLLVAVNPANARARGLYGSLGFTATGSENYDGDPVLVLERATATALEVQSSAPTVAIETQPDRATWIAENLGSAEAFDWSAWENCA